MWRGIICAAFMCLIAGAESSAQTGQPEDSFGGSRDRSALSLPDIFQYREDLKKKELTDIAGKSVPLDAPVNPEEYYVGPGDLLALNIWSSSPVGHQLTVTPEGTLLIPSIGLVNANGLTLAAVKKRVVDIALKKYPGSEITLTLISPRRISVQIVGNVFEEGTFEIESTWRAGNLIALANTPASTRIPPGYYERTLPFLRSSSSERHIQIRHRDNSVSRVDLVRYQTSRQGRFNPYLREGDIVHQPQRRDGMNDIAIFGGVKKFGGFEFVPGDSLLDLVDMGFGMREDADSEHVHFSRLSADGTRMETLTIDLKAIIEGSSPNIALRPGDRIFVPVINDPRRNFFVVVDGEVAQPGHYPISKEGTKLSDVLRMAGGFTKDAFIGGARLVRGGSTGIEAAQKVEEEFLLSKRSSAMSQDSSYFLVETALRVKGEPVAVDFHRLFVLGDSTQDVIVQTYDRIIVPRRQGTVYVFGQVRSPGHIAIEEGVGYKFYIDRAGGVADDARSGDVKIIKSGTRAWLNPGETTIQDGDFIWVPKEPHYPLTYYLSAYAQIASIVGVVATVALLVITVNK
jgi:polysaccharide export outer membrane protein